MDRGDWAGALHAYDASAALVGSHWRGELLDGGALAAQQLKRPDVTKRLEAAWHAAPTLTRLVRWLRANGHTLAVRVNAQTSDIEVELWSSPLYFLLMLLIVTAEWILRKLSQLK